MLSIGIDIGSTTTKAVLLQDNKMLAYVIKSTGVVPQSTAQEVFDKACGKAGVNKEDVEYIATTGYGRRLVDFGHKVITEIKAASLGVEDGVRTIIDVGGQDTKVINLNKDGKIEDFSMNDKCAAGTGKFLEVICKKLEFSYENFIQAALTSKTDLQMNSTCAVFAESEVVSMLARGVNKNDIAHAVHNAIAERIASMARRVGIEDKVCFIGGGALNCALVASLKQVLEREIIVPDVPQIIPAFGAANKV